MDELSTFQGTSPALKSYEAELFRCADLVFTGGQSLDGDLKLVRIADTVSEFVCAAEKAMQEDTASYRFRRLREAQWAKAQSQRGHLSNKIPS